MKDTVVPVQQLHRDQHLPRLNHDLLRDLRDDFLHVPRGASGPVFNEAGEFAIGVGDGRPGLPARRSRAEQPVSQGFGARQAFRRQTDRLRLAPRVRDQALIGQ